jgi:hypothetical protein
MSPRLPWSANASKVSGGREALRHVESEAACQNLRGVEKLGRQVKEQASKQERLVSNGNTTTGIFVNLSPNRGEERQQQAGH